MSEHLSFVVAGAPAIEVLATHRRLKWRRAPLVERVRRLHVVVTIHQHRGTTLRSPPRGMHNRMAARRNHLYALEPDAPQMVSQPGCAFFQIAGMCGLGADGREADEIL